jgi:hypothetical protein
MSYLDHDPELPAGYQEADILQAEYEAQGRAAAADRRRGICHHGWTLGGGASMNRSRAEIEEDRQRGDFPDRPTDPAVQCQDDIPSGQVLCLDCGQLTEDPWPEAPWKAS